MMTTDLPHGGKVSLDDLLQCRTMPRDVGRRLQESAGSEGQVTVDAVVGLLVDEKRAADDRKLTQSIIMQLLVALVVLLAAFAGSIYMVVKLDSVVGNDNGIMVSRSTGQPVAVGSVVRERDGRMLYEISSLDELLGVEHLTVTTNTSDGDTAVTVYNVASAQVLPGETAVLITTSGEEFEINQDGLSLVNTTSTAAGGRRRHLMLTDEQKYQLAGAALVAGGIAVAVAGGAAVGTAVGVATVGYQAGSLVSKLTTPSSPPPPGPPSKTATPTSN